MPGALDDYLAEISPLVGFKGGPGGNDLLAQLDDQLLEAGRAGQAIAFAFASMRVAWSSMPEEVRTMALDILSDAIDQAIDQISEGVGEVPVVGWIINAAVLIADLIREIHAGVETQNKATSLQMLNSRQIETFQRAKDPTDWVWGRVNGKLYMNYGGGGGFDRWREEPALPPVTIQSRAVGYPEGNPTSGNCDPGKPFKYRRGKWIQKSDAPRCSYTTQFSALFYPWWSPASPAGPLPYYGIEVWGDLPFQDAGKDPNVILIERQTLLVGDAVTNLQVSGDGVARRLSGFLLWFKYATIWNIDDTYIPASDYQDNPPAYLYLDDNGLLRTYARVAQAGKIGIDHVIAEQDGVEVTPAIYNGVVGMCRAFFTARAAYMQNEVAMKEYIRDGTAESFEGRVRSAIKVYGRIRGPKRYKKRKATGAGLAVAGLGGLALLAFLGR